MDLETSSMTNHGKKPPVDAEKPLAGEDVPSSVMHDIEQRINPLTGRMTAMETSITTMQQSLEALLQKLSGLGNDNLQISSLQMNSSAFADQDKVEFPSFSHHDPIKIKFRQSHKFSSFQFPEYQESSKNKSGNNNQFRQLDFPRPPPSFNHFREDSDDSEDE